MSNVCSGGTKLIYACSGAADVGQISDLVARKLAKEGIGKMTCLAGLGAHLTNFIESASSVDENIAIDGCQVACARKVLEHIGVPLESFILTEMGLEKANATINDATVSDITEKIKASAPAITNDKENGGCDCGGLC